MTDWSDLKPVRHGQAWIRRGSDDVAVYNPDDGQLHLLNPSAFAIWELCDGDTSADEMSEAIAAITEAGDVRAHMDVVSTLDRLQAIGLVMTRG